MAGQGTAGIATANEHPRVIGTLRGRKAAEDAGRTGGRFGGAGAFSNDGVKRIGSGGSLDSDVGCVWRSQFVVAGRRLAIPVLGGIVAGWAVSIAVGRGVASPLYNVMEALRAE
jgi:hypothetical protein